MKTRHLLCTASLVVLSASILAAPAAGAAAGKQLWVRTGGTRAHQEGFSDVAAGPRGVVYVCGSRHGAAVPGPQTLLLRKYGADGRLLWSRTYDGPGYSDFGAEVEVAPSGAVYVAGQTTGSGGRHDLLLVKYGANGARKWTYSYTSPADGDSWTEGLCLDGAGAPIVVGTSASAGDKTGVVAVKVRPDGTAAWTQRYDPAPAVATAEPISPSDVALDAAGDVFISMTGATDGRTWAAVLKLAGADGAVAGTSGFVVLMGTQMGATSIAVRGERVALGGWYQAPGSAGDDRRMLVGLLTTALHADKTALIDGTGTGRDCVYDVALDRQGDILAIGDSYMATAAGALPRSTIIKVDGTTGEPEWTHRCLPRGKVHSMGDRLLVDGSGNAYVAGWSSSEEARDDFLTVKYDTDGGRKWVRQWQGGRGDDEPSGLALARGCLYVSGTAMSRSGVERSVLIKYAR